MDSNFFTVGLCAGKVVFLSPLYPFGNLVTHYELHCAVKWKDKTVGIKIKQQQGCCDVQNYRNLHLVFPASLDFKKHPAQSRAHCKLLLLNNICRYLRFYLL